MREMPRVNFTPPVLAAVPHTCSEATYAAIGFCGSTKA